MKTVTRDATARHTRQRHCSRSGDPSRDDPRTAPQAMLIDIRMPRLPATNSRAACVSAGATASICSRIPPMPAGGTRRFMEAGFDAILIKPASLEDMRDTLPAPA